MKFDHINIAAPDSLLKKVRDFYCEIFCLKEGFRPPFKFAGYWLYDDTDHPVVHLSVDESRSDASNHLDHIAFQTHELEQLESRLAANNVVVKKFYIDATATTQLFFKDPANNKLEVDHRVQ